MTSVSCHFCSTRAHSTSQGMQSHTRQGRCGVCDYRVMKHGLHCIQQLTASDWLKQPDHRSILHAFLRAFGRGSRQGAPQSPPVTTGPMQAHEASHCAECNARAQGMTMLLSTDQDLTLLRYCERRLAMSTMHLILHMATACVQMLDEPDITFYIIWTQLSTAVILQDDALASRTLRACPQAKWLHC